MSHNDQYLQRVTTQVRHTEKKHGQHVLGMNRGCASPADGAGGERWPEGGRPEGGPEPGARHGLAPACVFTCLAVLPGASFVQGPENLQSSLFR